MADDLPEGFTIDKPADNSGLPEGFSIDQPTQQPSSYLPQAISDVPSEIGKQYSGAWQGLKEGLSPTGKGEEGVLQGTLNTGKGLLSAGYLATGVGPAVVGAARSLIGHPMAQAEHAVGTVINPAVAAKDNPEEMYQHAANDVETALAGARPGKFGPVGATTQSVVKTPPVPTTEELFEAGREAYKNAKGYGVEIKRKPLANLADGIVSELDNDGFRPINTPKTFGIIEELKNPTGKNATVADVDSVRKALLRAGSNPMEGAEREASRRAISAIDDYMSGLHPNDVAVNPHFANRVADELASARGNWGAAKRSELIEGREERAELGAAASGSGSNINNAIRQQVKQILTNPKLQRGFSPEELDQMRRIVKGTWTGNITRLIGKLAPHGVVSGGLSGALGYHLLGPAGVAGAWGVGEAAKLASDLSTTRQFRKLQNLVKSRSPIGVPTINTIAPSQPSPYLLPYAGMAMPQLNEPAYQYQSRGGKISSALKVVKRATKSK